MKLHSPRFEKALKRHWKRALASSAEVKREYRALKRHYRRQHSIVRVVRPFVPIVFGLIVYLMAEHSGHAAAMAFVAVLGVLFASYRAINLLQQLFAAPDLPALGMLPISEPQIFLWEFQGFFRRSLWTLADMIGAFAGLALYVGFSVPQMLAALLISLAVWAGIVALAALGAAYFPRLPYHAILGVIIGIFWFAGMIDSFRAQVLAFLEAWAGVIMMLVPTGWPVSLFRLLIPPVDWLYLVLIIPVIVLIGSLRFSIIRLRSYYEIQEPVVGEAPSVLPELHEDDDRQLPSGDTARESHGTSDIEDLVVTRKFLERPEWPQRGWLEKILWNWFTERERAVAEFAFTEGIEITKPWRKILISMLLASLVSGGVSILFPLGALWVMFGGFFVAFCQIMAQLSGARVFATVPSSGVLMSWYCTYPVGYFEVGRLLMKRAAVQIAWLFALPITASLIAAYVAHWPIQSALIVGVKIGGVLFAATFIAVALGFSGGTNDTQVRFRTLPFLAVMAVCVLAGLGLAIGAAFSFRLAGWICWLLLMLDAYAVFGFYGYFYNKKTFDLMRMPRGA